jgi:hypothetical protein
MVQYVIRKPFGIAVLMAILGFIGAVGSLAATAILASAVFGDGPYRMNGEVVTRAEFLRFAVPFTAVYLVGCLLALCTAWFIYSENSRSRPLLLAYFTLPLAVIPVLLVSGEATADVASALLPLALLPLGAWLYLYRKSSVRAYYAALDRPKGSRQSASDQVATSP